MFLNKWWYYVRSIVWSIAIIRMKGADADTGFVDCDVPCDDADVNYELVTSIRSVRVMNYTYIGRLYENPDDPNAIFGPTLHVAPGQSISIKLRNNIQSEENSTTHVTIEDYWTMLLNPGEKIKYQYYKKRPDTIQGMKIDHPNIPHNFDSTNLHLHGLDIEVHMFHPVATHRPDAPHIVVEPSQCYCYKFNVPIHHPGGLYWYHPHLHGSSAVQIWGGMLGVMYVDGPLEEELQRQGVDRGQEFVIWDPAMKAIDEKTISVDDFLMGQTTLSKIHPFLVNGEYNPKFQVEVGETLWLRVLCATIENEVTFIVYPEGREDEPWDDTALPFWVIGTDGVSHSPQPHNILVLAGGQRAEILMQFDQPGQYVISQQGIQGMQFFDMWGHPHDQILATITVTEGKQDNKIDLSEIEVTPGYPPEEDIQAHSIERTETIVFSMGSDRDKAPFPQYYVNGKAFDPDRLDFYAHPNEAVEYILINGNHNVHPFHIHVNRFQVQEMGSELSIERYPVLKHVMEFDPKVWRDTVIVPPNGRARIWVQYNNYTGKTLFHCHFLAHEDTGMMSTLFIGEPDFVFRFEDHGLLLFACAVGMIVGVSVMLVRNRKISTVGYEAVALNELKSKAQD